MLLSAGGDYQSVQSGLLMMPRGFLLDTTARITKLIILVFPQLSLKSLDSAVSTAIN
jgi:hypothetical protein